MTNTIWAQLKPIFNLLLPAEWTLWEQLMVIGVLFGVVVWIVSKMKGE